MSISLRTHDNKLCLFLLKGCHCVYALIEEAHFKFGYQTINMLYQLWINFITRNICWKFMILCIEYLWMYVNVHKKLLRIWNCFYVINSLKIGFVAVSSVNTSWQQEGQNYYIIFTNYNFSTILGAVNDGHHPTLSFDILYARILACF